MKIPSPRLPRRLSPSRLPIANYQLTQFTKFSLVTLATTLALSTSHQIRADSQAIPDNIQSAVDRGLQSLAHAQQPDGAWTSGGAGGSATAAVTGLATMAFMARGHIPGQGPYGDALNRAIDAILTLQQPDGLIASRARSHPMYEHGICTVALCEAYGMLDDKRQQLAQTAISRAVRLILDAQNVPKSRDDQGGWRYQPKSDDSDLSVSGWQLMALRGAANVGANIPQRALDSGIDYVRRRAVTGQGGFSYRSDSSAPNAALTGTGILALALLGHPDAPQVKAGGDFLLRTPIVQTPNHYFYTVYYCSQAAWQLGGQYWTDINREISSDLLHRQLPNGSWTSATSGDNEGGDSYCTAMAILSLTVPYRYLPIYQR